MKMLFRSGTIGENKGFGIDKIRWQSNDTTFLMDFDRSLWQVIGLFNIYDTELYGKINQKPVFYFYDRRVGKAKILEELDRIIKDGDVSNVTNPEDAMIKEAIQGTDLNKVLGIENGYQVYVTETIYWDIINHFVVIIGRDALVKFAKAMEEECYRTLASSKIIDDLISEKEVNDATKKMLLLAQVGE